MMQQKKFPWSEMFAALALFFVMAVGVYGATLPPDTDPPEYECGNGVCSAEEMESGSCPADCGSTDTDPPQTTYVCGNGMCETGETTTSCPADCSGSPNDDNGDDGDDGGSNDEEDNGDSGGGGSSSRNLLIQRILEQLVAVLTELINLVIAQRGV